MCTELHCQKGFDLILFPYQVPELTIALHERVENYIKDLQRRLHDADSKASARLHC